MRATCLRNSITTSVVIGLWALAQGLSRAEAQAAVPDNSTKSSVHNSAPPAAERAAPSPLLPAPGASTMPSSVSLSPAVAVVNCKLGQSTTQTLTLTNRTDQELVFEMIAEDVIVKDGKRIFVAAGETPGGIAFTAVFSRKEVVSSLYNSRRSASHSHFQRTRLCARQWRCFADRQNFQAAAR